MNGSKNSGQCQCAVQTATSLFQLHIAFFAEAGMMSARGFRSLIRDLGIDRYDRAMMLVVPQ